MALQQQGQQQAAVVAALYPATPTIGGQPTLFQGSISLLGLKLNQVDLVRQVRVCLRCKAEGATRVFRAF